MKGEEQAKNAITEIGGKFNEDWLHLFWYRHKILWAYRQGQVFKKCLEENVLRFRELREKFKILNVWSDYHTVQKLLDDADAVFYDYVTKLADLEQQSHTIDVNWINYQKRLQLIEKKAGQPLTCLNKFSREVQDLYGLQVQKAYTSFTSELKVWKKLIRYVRTRVEVEKEEREKKFQHRISFFGMALGAGAIMASISGHFPTIVREKALEHPLANYLHILPEEWVAPAISVIFSVWVALIFGFVAYWLFKPKNDREDGKNK